MAATRKLPTTWTAADLDVETGQLQPRVSLLNLFVPERIAQCEIIEGEDAVDAGRQLALKLREAKLQGQLAAAQSKMRAWFSMAVDAHVVRRPSMFAVRVGPILIASNHGGSALDGPKNNRWENQFSSCLDSAFGIC